MKEYFNFIKDDRLVWRIFILTFILIVTTFIYVIINYSKLPPLLPVFNQLPWGEKRLSEAPGIFIPVVIVFIIFIVNLALSAFTYSKSPLIARILAITSFLTSLLAFLFLIRTIQLIT
ncbi:MAG: hypothetical protein HYW63_00570 [Candidatus Levybacteria bacterium]|nr:hypothetical protein [Candidatus Levybacteria bacterium]